MAHIKAYLNHSDSRDVPAIVIMGVSIGLAVSMLVPLLLS
jgi:hypothetical protein